MDIVNLLTLTTRAEFRAWRAEHSAREPECWVEVRKGNPENSTDFWYLDAVEEALCFGWIDSTNRMINGKRMQRFSPRRPKSAWTELNKARVRRLEVLGLMTDAGRVVLPEMSPEKFVFDPDVKAAL